MSNKPIALFAGSFDPPTLGHYDLIKRAQELFGQVLVVVASHPTKKNLFSAEQRAQMIREDLIDLDVVVQIHEGLLVDYARRHDVKVLVRGVRNTTDFEYESQMAYANGKLSDSIETVFLTPSLEFSKLSSSLIQEIYLNGGQLPSAVSKLVHQQLVEVNGNNSH